MNADPLVIVALAVDGAAWLLCASALILDLFGRWPFKRLRTPSFRLRVTAGLALMTGTALMWLSEIFGWARPLRGALDIVDMVLALAFLVCLLIAVSMDARARRPRA